MQVLIASPLTRTSTTTGADPTVASSDGQTPLHVAVARSGKDAQACVDLLLAACDSKQVQ